MAKIIEEIQELKFEDLMKSLKESKGIGNFIKDNVKPKNGIYFYVSRKPQGYIFGESKIVYIGKGAGKNGLRGRLKHHFITDMRDEEVFIKEVSENHLQWPCQNYFINKKNPCNIMFFQLNKNYKKPIKEIEGLFIGIFMAKYGVPPICNSKIERKAVRNTYKNYCNNKGGRKILKEIDDIINKWGKTKNGKNE